MTATDEQLAARTRPRRSRVIALCNQKGGVGKSTTTFHLAIAAIAFGLRVLCVDLDPQGNLTQVMAADAVDDDQAGVADVLSDRADEKIRDVIVPGIRDGIDLAPTSGETLGMVRDELVVAGLGRELRLREALVDVREDYDLILVDCPPSLDQLTVNALTAADGLLIITTARLFSANGLAKLLRNIEAVKQYFNRDLEIAGVVMNEYEPRTRAARHWRDQIAAAGLPILDPPVPKRVAIADSAEAAVGLDQWKDESSLEVASIYAGYLPTILNGEAR